MSQVVSRYPEWAQAAIRLLRDDLVLCHGYRPGPVEPLPVPIHVFAGDKDPLVPAADAQAWGAHAGAGCTVHGIPGGHFFTRDSRALFLSRVASVLRGAEPTSGRKPERTGAR